MGRFDFWPPGGQVYLVTGAQNLGFLGQSYLCFGSLGVKLHRIGPWPYPGYLVAHFDFWPSGVRVYLVTRAQNWGFLGKVAFVLGVLG